jgi:hypothetical protein
MYSTVIFPGILSFFKDIENLPGAKQAIARANDTLYYTGLFIADDHHHVLLRHGN